LAAIYIFLISTRVDYLSSKIAPLIFGYYYFGVLNVTLMKNKPLFLSLLLLLTAGTTFAQGIQFENTEWSQVLSKAKKQNKLVYVDVYTTWCGPCKIMASTIFLVKEVGDKYNDLFINYKIDAEKGFGIDLAKKYKVEGYPTNLYINPRTEEVVYRVMGSTDVSTFLERADIAIAESKDPMSWQDYEAKLATGIKDAAFLKAYLTKAKRLDKPNDAALDVYVAHHLSEPPSLDQLRLLLEHANTYSTQATELLLKNREQATKVYPDNPERFDYWLQSLPYATLTRAVEKKEIQLLAQMDSFSRRYNIVIDGPSGILYYYREFYQKAGEPEQAWQATITEADYLMALSDEDLLHKDEAAMEQIRESLKMQLIRMNVPEDKHESSIAATIEKNPSIQKSVSYNVANALNSAAWQPVERKVNDHSTLSRALKWSERSMTLTEGSPQWAAIADTYAQLMWLKGDKTAAISMQERAVAQAKQMNPEVAEDLELTLKKMKEQ
jgi:thiol-disulfide isomerase/thioredoxin